MSFMEILNYLKINDLIHTSGQPGREDFRLIAETGAVGVINLAMPDHESALSNEGELVTSTGMNYFHIPVIWSQPEPEQYALFQTIMLAHSKKIIWVHCALNWRVSSFMYLYQTKCLGVSENQARKMLTTIWSPDDVWARFIKDNA